MNKEQAHEQYQKAITLTKAGCSDEAIVAFQEAIRLDPDNEVYLDNFGLFYRRMDRNEEAIVLYQEAIRNNLSSVRMLKGLAISLHANDKYEEAIDVYKEVIQLTPQDVQILNLLASAYTVVGDNEAAIKAYKQLIALRPDDYKAHDGLGLAYIRLGLTRQSDYNLDAIIKSSEISISIMPNSPDAYSNLGTAYVLMNDLGKAHEQAEILAGLDEEQYDLLIDIINDQGLKNAIRKAEDERPIALQPEPPRDAYTASKPVPVATSSKKAWWQFGRR